MSAFNWTYAINMRMHWTHNCYIHINAREQMKRSPQFHFYFNDSDHCFVRIQPWTMIELHAGEIAHLHEIILQNIINVWPMHRCPNLFTRLSVMSCCVACSLWVHLNKQVTDPNIDTCVLFTHSFVYLFNLNFILFLHPQLRKIICM